jgi:hypothetical protein
MPRNKASFKRLISSTNGAYSFINVRPLWFAVRKAKIPGEDNTDFKMQNHGTLILAFPDISPDRQNNRLNQPDTAQTSSPTSHFLVTVSLLMLCTIFGHPSPVNLNIFLSKAGSIVSFTHFHLEYVIHSA